VPHQRRHCAIDAQQLAQVMINLLVNATDAAPEGATSRSRRRCCRPACGAAACTTVAGHSPDVLPRVFEIFFSTKPGGTGIGLAALPAHRRGARRNDLARERPECGTTATDLLPLVSA
jgi:signal transduction histidine kinase